MGSKFNEIAFTDSVLQAQQHYYGKSQRPGEAERDALADEDTAFIHSRDSFYMATVSETGWPYIQHRGGKPGFLHVCSPTRLAFADYKGNRQMVSTGNVAHNDRVALFLMDYPNRERLKILGRARIEDAKDHPDLVAELAEPDVSRSVERLFFIDIVGLSWNCPQHITPRYTMDEIEKWAAPLKQRIAELEEQIRQLKG
jgi:hypothetical protein